MISYDTLDIGWWGPKTVMAKGVNHSGVGIAILFKGANKVARMFFTLC